MILKVLAFIIACNILFILFCFLRVSSQESRAEEQENGQEDIDRFIN